MSTVLVCGIVLGLAKFFYVDPNTGGLMFQALVAFFAIFSGVMLFFSRQIKTFVNRARRRLRKDEDPDSQARPGDK